jgi:hypothetical protein
VTNDERALRVGVSGREALRKHLEAHIRPVALAGKATVDDLRPECLNHDSFEAVRVFGRAHMARY